MQDVALAYAARGFPVFPLLPGEKKPHGNLAPHGFRNATTDPAVIEGWWAKEPKANIGIPTGNVSGWVVIDTDKDDLKSLDGEEALRALEKEHGALPKTVMQLTPRGGNHRVYRDPGGIRCSAGKLGPGVDVRGTAGYVAVDPSTRPDGSYEWELDHHPDELEPAELPDKWIELLRDQDSSKAKSGDKSKPESAAGGPIPEGRRNDTLASIGGSLRRMGHDEEEILTTLQEVNSSRCEPLLPDPEVAKIAHSMAQYEPGAGAITEATASDLRENIDVFLAQAKETQDPGHAFQAIEHLVQLSAADYASYTAKFKEILGSKLNLNDFARAFKDAKKEAAPDRKNLVIRLAEHILEKQHFAKNEGQQLYHFEAGHYVRDGDIAIQRLVKESLTDWGEIDSWSSFRGREVFNYILTGAQQLWTHRPPDEIPVLDGILNLRTITLRPHDPAFLSPIQFPVIFDPDARCEKIDKFFEEVFPKGAADLGYEMITAIIDPAFDDQKADLLSGPGGSGKSTFLTLVINFIGIENVSTLSLHTLENNRFAISELYGKVANICADLPGTRLSHTSNVKSITGGDTVQAEIKNGRFFSFRPYARLLFATNHLPRADDADEAFYQ